MIDDSSTDDLKSLWKEVTSGPVRISLDELRSKAEALRVQVRRKHLIGVTAALIVIGSFTAFFFVFSNLLQRLGSLLTVVGTAYMFVQLGMRTPASAPGAIEVATGIEFYRTELKRQRDFHRGAWFWSRMLIFLPGPLVFLMGFAQAFPELAPFIKIDGIAFIIMGVIAVPLNLGLARKYQHRIDALDAVLRDNREAEKKDQGGVS